MNLSWLLLIVAGFFEVLFAFCLGKLKESTGLHAYFWFGGFIITMAISLFLLIKAVQHLPVGTSYAVWTGIGAVGTVLVGIFVFKEPVSFGRIFFLLTLIGSIIGLKLCSN